MAVAISLLNIFSLLCLTVVAQEECKPAQCQQYYGPEAPYLDGYLPQVYGPEVQYPFWLKGHQPHHCGHSHPDFGLSCSSTNTTQLEFQYPIRGSANNLDFPMPLKVEVLEIDYNLQKVYVFIGSMDYCLPNQLPTAVNNISFPPSPFEISDSNDWDDDEYCVFNCSSGISNYYFEGFLINCLSGHGYQVFSYPCSEEMLYFNNSFSSCAKMYRFSGFVPYTGYFYLRWLKPSREECKAQGKYCPPAPEEYGTYEYDQTGSFDIHRNGTPKKLIIAVVLGSLSLLTAIGIVSRCYRYSLKRKKEDQKTIEKFLDDYKDLKPSRVSYADIKKITDKFKEKLGEGGYGTVFKGNLSNDILVAVKVLKNFKGDGEEFINEVGTIGKIHHKNVVRLVGYCADGYNRALLYEFLPNDTLEKIISSRNRIKSLGWEKLQQIAIDIAKGIDYLHQGCNQRILHFDIKPQNILLDHNFNPKVADFGLAKLCSKDQSAVSMTAARGTIGYIAPEVFSRNFGNVSYKSDVYSFGMLLLDMVGGRKRFQAAEEGNSEIYYPEWMYKQLEKGEEIEIQVDSEEENRIFKKLSIVGLWCIQWCPADRPSMKVAIQMLEGENMPPMPPNPFTASEQTNLFALPSNSEICSISETTSSSMQ